MMNFSLKRKLRGKGGSSLPMVLAIGLVLVVWVMGLSPIVATQGKASIDVQQQEEDYLQSRSAIEFTKGELVNMVAYGSPRTFAVVKGAVTGLAPDATDEQFTAVNFQNNRALYENYVNIEQGSLTGNGTPQDTDLGDEVCAICHVEKLDKIYDINITTYCNGESNLTYHTTYTPPVASKMINPEAYKKTQALPLSDYVLVDGKYGSTVVWNSTLTSSAESSPHTSTNYITKSSGRFSSYSANFHETFLPVTGGVFQGDAKNLPAVFKKTVEVPDDPNAAQNMPDTVRFEDAAQPTVSIKWAEVMTDYGDLTVTLTHTSPDNLSSALYCCTNASGTVADWQSNNTFTIPNASGCYTFYCYIPQQISTDGKTIYRESDISSGVTLSVYMPTDFSSVTPNSSGMYYMYSGSAGNPSTFLKMNSSGSLYNSTTKTQVYYDGVPVWKVGPGSTSRTFFVTYKNSSGNNTSRYLRYNSEKFQLSDSMPNLDYSDNTISYTESSWFGWNNTKYYLDIDGTNFISTNPQNTYFATVNPPALTLSPAPAKPAPVTLSISAPEVTVDTTLTWIKSYYEGKCPSWVTSPKAYVVASGNEFKVYISGYKDGRYFFTEVGEVALEARGYGVAGAELYFMGQGAAVKADNPIYIKADLLVIRDDVADGDGPVYVTSYNENYGTLAFFVNGTGPFEAYNFYKLGNNKEEAIDLTSVSDEQAAEWLVRDEVGSKFEHGSVVTESDGTVTSIEFPDRVLELENSGKFRYPVINFDIAYASPEQLAYVVSGEAIKWTSNGVLQDSSDDLNSMYVVCPYITAISGDVTRSANRILTYAGTRDLTVSSTIKFYTRYLSFDTDRITKGSSSAHFYLYSLTKQAKWSDSIEDALGSKNYSSKTMQVDYECSMELSLSNSSKFLIDPQICRYESGTDLFNGAVIQPLQASYTTSEIEDQLSSLLPTITIIDRYVDISGSSLTLYNIILEADIYLYSNYIAFDSSLTRITVPALIRDGLTFSSQETGYTENEYLFLFKTSTAEEYNGTLIHFESDVDVYKGLRKSHTIEAGFYAVPAGETANVLDLNKTIMPLEPEELLEYSSVIDKHGSMDSAYVDTGFETDDSVEGGFGGGSVN